MHKLLFVFMYLVAMIGFALQSAYADSETGIAIEDAGSVEEAVVELTATLENQGVEVVLIVDHAAAADSVGLELRPTQVIFARQPRIFERSLLKRSDTIGIDLPLKHLVFEDEQGVVRIISNSVGYLVDRHEVKIRDPILSWLQSKVEQFSTTPDGLVTIASNLTFEDTILSLRSAIPSPPFRIPLELDFGDSWGRDGTYRNTRLPVLLVFGNPLAGTPLMQADQRIGLDLPQKFLVWKDRDGGVNISWNDPFFIAARYNIQGQEQRLTAIADALNNFAQIGAGN